MQASLAIPTSSALNASNPVGQLTNGTWVVAAYADDGLLVYILPNDLDGSFSVRCHRVLPEPSR